MKLMRKFVLPAAGAVAVAFLFAIASPRAVHAVVAALVQVTNTPTNAVPAVQAPAASQLYRGSCSVEINGDQFPRCSFPQVPTGQTLFVETVSVSAITSETPLITQLVDQNGDSVFVPMTNQGEGNFLGTVGVRASFLSGVTPVCLVQLSSAVRNGGLLACNVFGYLAPAQ
ncbi:MAG: hypothetical protein JO336_08315 [Acidobacteriia bacterium]|nr:hypothetical protein [Terriglobia bacterium]MBV8906193.1 hypothetical protein [Terriglobia bacterium]